MFQYVLYSWSRRETAGSMLSDKYIRLSLNIIRKSNHQKLQKVDPENQINPTEVVVIQRVHIKIPYSRVSSETVCHKPLRPCLVGTTLVLGMGSESILRCLVAKNWTPN